MKCPYCYSPKIEIVASRKQRDVTVIRCLNCGRTAEMDVENVHVDADIPGQPKTGDDPGDVS